MRKLYVLFVLLLSSTVAQAIDIQSASCFTNQAGQSQLDVVMQVSLYDLVLHDELVIDINDGGTWKEIRDNLQYTGGSYQTFSYNLYQQGMYDPTGFQLAIDDSPIIMIGSCY